MGYLASDIHFSKYADLKLNSQLYNKNELILKGHQVIADQNSNEWLIHIWSFILEWLNDDEFTTTFTSGSTGKPKELKIHKQKMVNSALGTGHFFSLKPDNKALLCLPANYIAGKMMIVRSFVLGLDLYVTEPSSHPLQYIKEHFHFVAMVPLQVEESLKKNSTFNINTLIIGGAPISTELLQKIKHLNTKCFATYGMTETITHVAIKALNTESSNRYIALPEVQFSIDNENRLLINAPRVCDQKIHTNDIVELISSTEFSWKGRFDHVINSGGIKLFPESIEDKIKQHINGNFMISSILDKSLGEKVIIIIENKSIIHDDLNHIFKKHLNKYERPKQIYKVDNLAFTKNGKIDRIHSKKLIET